MKQNYSWFGLYYKKFLTTFTLAFMVSALFAQTLTNGNLGTGATSLNGTAAAAGTTWHELQNVTGNTTESNSLLGVSHASQGTTNNTLTDDFVVPGGNTWTINTLTMYSLDQVVAPTSTTSPYTNVRVRIWNGIPGAAGSTIVFGDMTTNRFASTAFSGRKGIFNSQVPTPGAPTPNLPIFSITANLGTTAVLTAGTYWIEWQVVHTANCFSPTSQTVGIRTLPAYNGRQSVATVWAQLVDGGNPATAPDVAVDLPFTITYTAAPTTPCTGTPAPGNTVSTTSAACPGTPFTLSLQNAIPGTGVTYQWQQSTTGVGGPYTNIPLATNPTYSVATIAATTFYQAVVTCGGNSATSTPVGVNSITCYCASAATSTADEDIFNVTFGSLNNSSTCATLAPGAGSILNRYSNYTGYAGAPVATVLRGLTTPLSIQIGTCGGNFTNSIAAWIDYNQDGTFAATERVYNSAAGTVGPHTETANILVPVTATPGTTRMRVVNVETGTSTGIQPCSYVGYTWGETEDYNVNIVVPTPCTGAPAPGNTLSTQSSVCSGATPFTLSLQNNPPLSGLTYQWFSGPTAGGTFTAIAGATGSTYSLPNITVATCYYAAVTCSGVTTNSTPVCVTINPPNQCYCASAASSTADEEILNVTVGNLNNSSTCATLAPGTGSILNRYSNYTGYPTAPAAATILQGTSIPVSIQIGTCGGNFTNSTAIFIDLNADGDFVDAGERVYTSASSFPGPHVETGNLIIPATAALGITRMRVVNSEVGTPLTIPPCSGAAYIWGETEDYNVNIVPCSNPSITAQPSITNNRCNGNATVSVTVAGPLPNIIWQYRTSPTGLWTNVVNGLNNGPTGISITGVGTSALLLNSIQNNHNGWEFRILYNNPCNASLDVSNTTTLTVLPMLTTVSLVPNPASICLGNVQTISITNPAIVTPVQVTATSGAINIPIPDNALAGITNSVTFAAGTIPAGATITNVTVTLNAPAHTYASDLVFALKAPNGNVINLDWFINGTGVAGAGLVNTRLSSTATNFLSTGSAPWNGVFRADLAPINGANPTYPTGFLGTGTYFTSWATLLASLPSGNDVSGNWTLGVYDGGPADVGNLTNWSINVTYTSAPVSVGVYTGAAGTLFTNAAATTAYTGGLINTIYVKPLVNGVSDYVLNFTSGNCIAPPLTIPVTANQAPTGTVSLPATTSLCIDESKTITVAGAANIVGGPIFHQFQVRPNSTSAWTNVSNGGIYSGATTSTLTITNPTVAINNFQFRDSIYTGAGCGFLLTNATTVSVNPKPVVTISAAPIRNLFPGLTTTLTAAVSPNATGAAYQWFKNGTAVAGATTNMLVVGIDALGTYSIRVTDANGCQSATGTSTPGSIVIGDSSNLTKLFIYPSPNKGSFQVRFFNDITNGGQIPSVVNVYDEKGSRVFTQTYTIGGGYQPMNVNLGPNHGRGIYRVDLLTRTGERIKTGSVIIF